MQRPLAVAAVVLAIALSLVLSAWRVAHRVPESSLDAAAATVREHHREGDLIVVDPWPQVGPRLRLGDLPLLEPRALEPDDLTGYQRVQLLELDAIGASAHSRELLAELGNAASTDAWPAVRLTTFELRFPVRAVFDLSRDIDQAQVTARYPGGESAACDQFRRDRWVCPRNPDWSYVGREIQEIGDEPRACVWLHPLHRGGELSVALPTAFAAKPGSSILGGYGFTDHAAGAAQAPVQLRIAAGEASLLEVNHPVSRGWRRYRVDLPIGHAPLQVSVRSENNGVAHFCFALRVVEPLP